MTSEKFCLKWNDFETNVSVAFRELRDERDFFDVTIACEDDQIQAHKVILSACSPFFKNLLRRNPHQHPLLYLKGISYKDIQSVLNFMYHGEANIAQDDLNNFLSVAEELKVKGLTQGNNSNSSNSSKPKTEPPQSQPQFPTKDRSNFRKPPVSNVPTPLHSAVDIVDDDIQEVESVPIKQETMDTSASGVSKQKYSAAAGYSQDTALAPTEYDDGQYYEEYDESYNEDYSQVGAGAMVDKGWVKPVSLQHEQLDTFIEENVRKEFNKWCCLICGKIASFRIDIARHIEAKHVSLPELVCDICGTSSKTRDSLRRHVTKFHKN